MLSKRVHVDGFMGQREVSADRLYRYMPLTACERMVATGEVRVSSSTKFENEDLTDTRQDDEQTKGRPWYRVTDSWDEPRTQRISCQCRRRRNHRPRNTNQVPIACGRPVLDSVPIHRSKPQSVRRIPRRCSGRDIRPRGVILPIGSRKRQDNRSWGHLCTRPR